MGFKRGQSYSSTPRLSPRIVFNIALPTNRPCTEKRYTFVNYYRLTVICVYKELHITLDIEIEHTGSI